MGPLPHRPAVGHFPLGTGNDMSRSQGWGPGYAGESIKKVLLQFASAEVAGLDRWRVTFDGASHGYTPAMNNYFEIGLNAQVAHKFHTSREANPEKFTNRSLNKLKYVVWGVTSSLQGLAENLTVFCDGVKVELPEDCQSLAILNLPSYAAGQHLWDESETRVFGKNFFSDGLMEVVSMKSSVEVGLAKVGIKPLRIAQCKQMRIVITDVAMPVQMDGEPWIQDPCTIDISLLNTAPILCTKAVAVKEELSKVNK